MALALFVWTGPCFAQSAPGDRVRATLQALASPDYAVRERTTWRLLRDDDLSARHIADLYAAAETPEQRHRLLDVARHHAVRRMRDRAFDAPGDRGAIGMTHHREALPPGSVPGLDLPAIEVIQPMPGFPAYTYLRPGDLIVGLDGENLPVEDTMGHFKRVLQSHRPGQRVQLTIHRAGELHEHALRLASYEALNLVYNAGAARMPLRSPFREQWLQTRADLLAEGPTPTPLRVTPLSRD
ncbi:MAG: PDZ domain-containing protein [Phycisphaeraceae bacterium]